MNKIVSTIGSVRNRGYRFRNRRTARFRNIYIPTGVKPMIYLKWLKSLFFLFGYQLDKICLLFENIYIYIEIESKYNNMKCNLTAYCAWKIFVLFWLRIDVPYEIILRKVKVNVWYYFWFNLQKEHEAIFYYSDAQVSNLT